SSAAVAGETAVPAMEEPAGQPAAEEGAVSTPKPERAPVELTDEDVARFAAEKPEEAARLAGIESPTRKDWKGTGLPMVGAEGRKAFAGKLRAMQAPDVVPPATEKAKEEPKEEPEEEPEEESALIGAMKSFGQAISEIAAQSEPDPPATEKAKEEPKE